MPAKNKKEYAAEHYKNNAEAYKKSLQDRRLRNQQWFFEKRKDSCCQNCGLKDFRCMEFHHLRDKEFEIWYGVHKAYSIARLETEIAKCESLCANCHRVLHYEDTCLWYKKIESMQ